MLSTFEAAKKICIRSDWTISDLELQKMLFLAQKEYMKDHDGRLIDAGFEAWDYGPVVPSLYRAVKMFGSDPIENIFHSIRLRGNELDPMLFRSYDSLSDKSPAQLISMTHREDGAWAVNYRPGVFGIPIPDVDIRNEARYGKARPG
jgi:uncharacterized phage-associated protein